MLLLCKHCKRDGVRYCAVEPHSIKPLRANASKKAIHQRRQELWKWVLAHQVDATANICDLFERAGE